MKKEKGVDLHRPIRSLYDAGFFRDGKNDLDVIQELQKRLMTTKKPLRSSVVNVLRKMVSEGQLNRDYVTKDKKSILLYKNVTP